ncbi:DUF1572 domain-containing protein [Maribacter sp. HTCC2170]|uniref:DUF1572 domain-containing protein n=1 Tax=Maribacter sp. (strain HTCC2170 / KCCM 42371) TaxID=313603 RepID=UPI00006B481B|nr:DUF1572 domain-containing protein [Maribacter sp. HTCC2170]EAR01918.1 hypothetical protein FB2170_15358 [Maribacter sp. HTCC2170]
MDFARNYLDSAIFEFRRYKTMGDKTFAQLGNDEILWTSSHTDNSISQIVKHISGNMLSRWTNFLTEDGEKPWRHRDTEFEIPFTTKIEMIKAWEKGWQCLFDALDTLNDDNFDTKIKIRNEAHTIPEATNRQLAHYASHVGQLVLLGKMIKGENWISLSIPKGESEAFNASKFNK